ncbi:MAG: MBL fold metallo-hydrolase [Mycetocola sp.]
MNPAAAPTRWTTLVARVLAPNPGPMTLDGTNSLIVGESDSRAVVVVDPGPADDAHLEELIRAAPAVELILLTHHHSDHVEAAPPLAQQTGASVRAFDPRLCINGAPLTHGERIETTGIVIDVVATPGHTSDSVSFHLPGDSLPGAERSTGSMITGDTILGRGTTTIAHPDGSLGAYLHSLEQLAKFGAIPVLPAHGAMLPDLTAVCTQYLLHRHERLDQVRRALRELDREPSGDPALVSIVADVVYPNIDPAVRFAAEASTRAQLEYLAQHPLT